MAAAPSTSTADEPTTPARTQDEDEPLLDISILKETARKALIDALNSVHPDTTLVRFRSWLH